MNCEALGRDLSAFVMHLCSESRQEIAGIVEGAHALTDANLLVLYHWAATWQVSDLVAAQFAQLILDSMHEGMFHLLRKGALDDSEAERFVHERYAVYHDTIKTREPGDALHHIGACFLGFCNQKEDGQVYHSLDSVKIVQVVIQLGAFTEMLQKALVVLLKQYGE